MGVNMGVRIALSGRGRWQALASVLALGLCVLLAACVPTAPSAARSTPTASAATATSAPPATPTMGGPPTPTITPLPGAGNLAGATDICTSPISVSTTLPAEIPAYSGQLRLAQSNNGDAEFGYCSGDSVDTITSFYTAQLPGKGWQSIQTFTNNATRNIIATRGGENLTITVSPDVVQTGSADLLIILTGQ
jgi:hypothetical protein